MNRFMLPAEGSIKPSDRAVPIRPLLVVALAMALGAPPSPASASPLWTGVVPGADAYGQHRNAVDSNGNVVAISNLGGDWLVVKYNPAGSELWRRTYDSGGNDNAGDVAVDGAGNVYVTGYSSEYSITTIKYDAAGGQLWLATHAGFYSVDRPNRIALDGAGSVYVGTSSAVQDGPAPWLTSDFLTIKYSTTGVLSWSAWYAGPAQGADVLKAIRVDGAGDVLVTGFITGAGSGTAAYDVATVKYSSSGSQLWVARYEGPANDEPRGLGVDAQNNVFVTGRTRTSTTDYDFLTIKYSAAGSEQWRRTYAGFGGNRYDYANALVVDNQGRVTVTGQSEASRPPSWCTRMGWGDMVTVQYDGAGAQRWVARQAIGSCSGEEGNAIATDASDNLIVTGKNTQEGTGSGYLTVKYDTTGRRKWSETYITNSQPSGGRSVNTDAAGNAFVTGNGDGLRTFKYAP